jgi:hypothetical protein
MKDTENEIIRALKCSQFCVCMLIESGMNLFRFLTETSKLTILVFPHFLMN